MNWIALGQTAALGLYGLVTVVLAATALYYGLIAVERVLRTRSNPPAAAGTVVPTGHPPVTIQIPVYNERHVIDRLLKAVGKLDWPSNRLQVQVIDDSTDETTAVITEALSALRDDGIVVEHIQRDERTGYKAGAIERGLETATGEFVALFDADFVPPPDFLTETIPHFQDPAVGCVQTRWDHLNESYSWFTRAQALALDAHFAVEQWVRADVGSLMSFNATSCVWRRATLADVGGWSSETIAEDLDLTAAALLAGWEFVYTEGYAVPCEIPVTLSGFVRQQTRWARGSTQNVRKHLPAILQSDVLGAWATFHSVLHVCHYVFYPILLAWILLHVVVTVFGHAPRWLLLAGFLGATPGPLLFLGLGQLLTDRQGWGKRVLATVPLTLIGVGIAWRMAKAVVVGFIEMGGVFARTPKFGIKGPRRAWDDRRYDPPLETTIPEVLVAGWCVFGTVLALATGAVRMAPSLAFFSLAFGTVVGATVHQR